MKTKLEKYLKEHKIDEVEAMNELQNEGGVISDCCVWARDVAPANEDDAIAFLESRRVYQEVKII